jgi:predicted RNase H-like HicB family nuclease
MVNIEIQAVVWKEGRQYVSQCLNFDVASFGATKKKALANLREAVELYLDSNRKSKHAKISSPSLEKITLAYA